MGGATRLDRSILRQSPRGTQGGVKQLSRTVGTQSSCESHVDVELLFKQLGKPHHTFEHFACPLMHTHELQLPSSDSLYVINLSVSLIFDASFVLIALYGDNVDVFKHAEAGSDNTTKIMGNEYFSNKSK